MFSEVFVWPWGKLCCEGRRCQEGRGCYEREDTMKGGGSIKGGSVKGVYEGGFCEKRVAMTGGFCKGGVA